MVNELTTVFLSLSIHLNSSYLRKFLRETCAVNVVMQNSVNDDHVHCKLEESNEIREYCKRIPRVQVVVILF